MEGDGGGTRDRDTERDSMRERGVEQWRGGGRAETETQRETV